MRICAGCRQQGAQEIPTATTFLSVFYPCFEICTQKTLFWVLPYHTRGFLVCRLQSRLQSRGGGLFHAVIARKSIHLQYHKEDYPYCSVLLGSRVQPQTIMKQNSSAEELSHSGPLQQRHGS